MTSIGKGVEKLEPPYIADGNIKCIGKDVEKLEPSYIADGNIKWCNHFGKQPGCSSKT